MKKFLRTALTLLLCLVSIVSVYAAGGPQLPVIEGQMPDCYGEMGVSEIELFTNATSPDGGTLEYQWYSTTVENIATIRAIDGATGTSFIVPQELGVVYYCYAVWNVVSGARSQPVYSRLIRVEYYENDPITLELISAPNKVEYTSGERLDLTGLWVRIWTSGGYTDSLNGEGLEITKNPLVTLGEQKIKITYKDAVTFFIVTVKAAPHTHSYGAWMVTTPATCTQEGIRTKECDCGHTVREGIPALGHQWDGGKLTREPTATVDGEMTYTCTVCRATRTEAVEATGVVDDPVDTPEDPTDEPTDEPTIPTVKPNDTEASATFPWWIIVVIAAASAAVGALIVWLITRRRKRS